MTFVTFVFLFFCFLQNSLVTATLGVDVSAYISQWSCLRGQGVNFAIIRGYQSGGRVDPNVRANIANAKAAGIPYVDVYIFPCVPCGNAPGQARSLVSAIQGTGYGMIWLDIERLSWSSNQAANRDFITQLINTFQGLGVHLGVYTNYYNWQEIVGLGWTGASHLPLWYAHYDGQQNFHDFRAFGGWSSPAMKQYAGDAKVCGEDVDLNWYP